MPFKQTFANLILFENNYVDSDDFVGDRPFLWQKVSFPSLLGLLTHAVVIGIPLDTVKPRRFWFINFSLRTGAGYRHFQGQGEVVARGSPSRIIIISFAACRVFTQSGTLHGERFGCVPTATTPLIDFFVPARNPSVGASPGTRTLTPVGYRSKGDPVPHCYQRALYAASKGERHQHWPITEMSH